MSGIIFHFGAELFLLCLIAPLCQQPVTKHFYVEAPSALKFNFWKVLFQYQP